MSKLTKQLLCVLAVIIAVISLSLIVFAEQGQQAQGPECYEHGDVNADDYVDERDAIHILYHMMYEGFPQFQDRYPIKQDWNFDMNEQKDTQDVIYLLYHISYAQFPQFQDRYPLKGTIHDYYDPSWAWDDATGTAQVTFKCGCGEPVTYTTTTTEATVTVTAGQKVEATCVKAGSQKYTATVTVDGKEYTSEYTKTLPAGQGHEMVGTQDCVNGSHCANCDYAVAALGHSMQLKNSVAATCTEDAYELYACSRSGCQHTEKKTLAGTAAHSMAYQKDVTDGCKVTKWYKCANCTHTAAGTAASDTYYAHEYKAELTKEATCVSAGEKTYTCTKCGGGIYKEPVSVNDSHDWDNGTTAGNVTTHSCKRSGCKATKTTVSAQNTAVSNDALKDNELQLQDNASMKLDDKTVEGLDQEKAIKVNVEVVDPEEAGLNAQQQEQIGDAKVYDFSMTYDDGEPVSQFAGEVTISLPYQLEDGEDVDSINVWYIDDNGNPTAVKATYSNGFVTFTTSHFSYYTVTRLTPAERCALYGHNETTRTKTATCTEDGYTTKLCTRCGEVFSDVKAPRTGHDLKQNVTKAATCTDTGIYVETCKNGCGRQVSVVIPATGHAMKRDEKQCAEASCTQAGKEVSVCENGCGHTQEKAIAQLKHDYKAFENTKADCENKGLQTKKCQLCDDVVTVAETLPLGHKFETKNATWEWASNHLSATVTLTCSHDQTHTKVLTAVVTKKTEGGSCEVGASVTYTATASYNKESFTNTYTESLTAPGHNPGTQWSSDAAGHYHICQTCEQPVDKAGHTWDQGTVTQAPTCDKAGKSVYKCLICAYENEKTVPATKEHNYVNGVCTGCGREESACRHYATIETEVDLTGYNLCEGAQVTRLSCECGENVEYYYDLGCRLGEQEPDKEETIGGITFTYYTYDCEDCGLVLQRVHGAEDMSDECARQHYSDITATVDGKELFHTREKYEKQPHPPKILVETVDLAALGMCGESKIEMYRCGCEEGLLEPKNTFDCTWEHSHDLENGSHYICTTCGAERDWFCERNHEEGSCRSESRYTGIFYVDGKEVYRYTESDVYYEHDYEATDYEMLGETCEDGVILQLMCTLCDATSEEFLQWCRPVIRDRINLTDANICYAFADIYRCACGNNQYFELYGESGCQWTEVSSSETTQVHRCQVCQAVRTRETTVSQPEVCLEEYVETYTYTDADGKLLFTAYNSESYETHEWERTNIKFHGTSCEDGISWTNTCTKCGESYKENIYRHSTHETHRVDLGAQGLCDGSFVVSECMCGQSVDYTWSGTSCQWMPVAGDMDENYELGIYRCLTCGGIYRREIRYTATDDPCRMDAVYNYTFWKDQAAADADTPFATVTFNRVSYSHDVQVSFKLNDEALGCAGGYKVTETCKNCDYTDTWNDSGNPNHDEHYLVDRQQVSDGQLCSELYVETFQCPCGAHSSQQMVWEDENNSCDWQWAGNGYICPTCNTLRTESYTSNKVAGTTCQYQDTTVYTFSRNGETLFTAELKQQRYNHRFTYTFQLDGETCADGYDMFITCINCGAQEQRRSMGSCNTRPVEYQLLVNDEAMCGPVYLVHSKCACGKVEEWFEDSDCMWQWWGRSEDGREIQQCTSCGAQRIYGETTQPIEGTCQKQISANITYQVGDKTYDKQCTYTEARHNEVAVFNGPIDSCENGYTGYWKCQDCDWTGGNISSDGPGGPGGSHSNYPLAYYDLADYGLCGGYLRQYGCPCGQRSWVEYGIGCNRTNTGKVDPDTGSEEYLCNDCGNYFSYGSRGDTLPGTCDFVGTFSFKARNEEQTLLQLQFTERDTRHDTVAIGLELVNPNGTCNEGVNITWGCRNCDYTSTGYSHDHEQMETMRIDTACGGYVTFTQCACGQEKDISIYCDDMQSRNWSKTDENGVEHDYEEGTCRDCGLYYLRDSVTTRLPGCQEQTVYSYLVRYGDREETFEDTYTRERHNYSDGTAVLLPGSTSCEDGIQRIRPCLDCDHVETWTGSGHFTFQQGTIDLTELGGCQGAIKLYGCACGQESSWGWSNDCAQHVRSWHEPDANGIQHSFDQYLCGTCGINILSDTYYEQAADSCRKVRHSTLTITCGEQQLVQETTGVEWKHAYIYESTLDNPNGNCANGVTVITTCRYCDYFERSHYSDHHRVEIMRIDTDCGGYAYFEQCACGENEYAYVWCSSMSGRDWTETDANGVEHCYYEGTCRDCGLYYLQDRVTTKLPDCQAQTTYRYLVRYGDREESFEYASTYESHAYGPVSCALLPGSQSCEDGVRVSQTCADCGYTNSWTTHDHRRYTSQSVDLSELGACGGYITIQRCACGQYIDEAQEHVCTSHVKEWDEPDASGLNHRYIQYKCEKCGLEKLIDCYYEQTDDPCWQTYHRVFTFTCGEQQVVLRTQEPSSNHQYQQTYTLIDPNGTCEDGLLVTQTCKNCDYRNTWTSSSHRTEKVEDIDLSQYGSVCGGTLDHYMCPCGETEYWELNTECDLDSDFTSAWIEGALDESQLQCGNNCHIDSYFYRKHCAVTDPVSCGLNIRYASYWLKEEGCKAVQYEQWLLGYDEETGTYQKKIEYVRSSRTWHDYEDTLIDEIDEAANTRTTGHRYVCKDCRTTSTLLSTYINGTGTTLRWECKYENTLDDNLNKFYQEVDTYEDVTGEGNYELVLDRTEYIRADGTEYWYQHAYTYDIDNCKEIRVYTTSDNDKSTYEQDHHFYSKFHQDDKSATCSQPGYHHCWYTCNTCDKAFDNHYYDIEPGHDWRWSYSEDQFICYDCGLKGENGADGSIILEDLTVSEGGETDYVIGYYNPKKIDFELSLSIILDNAEGDNQIDLDFSEFTYKSTEPDGYQGITFNKAAADAAAAAAVPAGYEGTYAIRISFVPTSGTDTLDYAITFDSVTAQ